MKNKQSQFTIIILEPDETHTYTHSLPGPWGTDVTSSVPTNPLSMDFRGDYSIKILSRPNERGVDPETLKTSRQ
jgi:hypothetical protein